MAFTLLRSLHADDNNKTGPKTFDDTLLNGEILFKCQYFPCQKLFAIHMYFPYCLWNISIGNLSQSKVEQESSILNTYFTSLCISNYSSSFEFATLNMSFDLYHSMEKVGHYNSLFNVTDYLQFKLIVTCVLTVFPL